MKTNFLLSNKFYDIGYDEYGNPVQLPSVGKAALSGVASGAALGTSIEPGWGTLIGGVVGGAYGLFSGESQKNKAEKLLKNNQYPTYSVNKPILDNVQLAQNAALEGTPSQQYQQAMKNIQRQQIAAINSATNRKAGVATIGSIQQKSNDAMANLDAQSAVQRMKNLQTLYGVNNQYNSALNNQFDWNQINRYQQNYNYAMGLLGAGNQNIVGGVDKLTAGLIRSGLFSGGRGGNNFSNNSNVYSAPTSSIGNGYVNPDTQTPTLF